MHKMSKWINRKIPTGHVLVSTVLMLGATSAQAAAVDVSAGVKALTECITAVAAVGSAALIVVIATKTYKFVRQAL